jgi:hypothetical protein
MEHGSEPFEPEASLSYVEHINKSRGLLFHHVGHSNTFSISNLCTLQLAHLTIMLQSFCLIFILQSLAPGFKVYTCVINNPYLSIGIHLVM